MQLGMKKHIIVRSIIVLGILLGIVRLALLFGSRPDAKVPGQYETLDQAAALYPDYTDVTIPPNIAPLNFLVSDSSATAYVARFAGEAGHEILVGADAGGLIQLDTLQWREMLQASKGADITVSIFAKKPGGWVMYKPHVLSVAREDIDPFLSYRLIEPGYELYRQLGIYQRDLTSFVERPIYENNREYADGENHCINCHNYRNYSAENMVFHVRSNHGGTIVVHGDKASKVQIKDSTIITAGVYPAWYPDEGQRLLAFSTNKTGQTFHVYHPEKIEVMDEASDLLLYDAEKNEVCHILRTKGILETFPNWSPDGKWLYYTQADISRNVDLTGPDSTLAQRLVFDYDNVRYDLMRMPFDISSRTFGQPETVVDATSNGKSITLPRVSPDGRYVLYTLGNYGQFHIWHKSSDLWVKDLERDSCYALRAANSSDVDSYHSWSSNGRWIVFSSRRMDGNYTRPFIAYFDENGQSRKAFCLPQEDPEHNLLLLKSYNVPELTRDRVQVSEHELRRCIYETDGENARYLPGRQVPVRDSADGVSGASPRRPATADATSGASPKQPK